MKLVLCQINIGVKFCPIVQTLLKKRRHYRFNYSNTFFQLESESGQQAHIQYSQIRPKVETKPQLELSIVPSESSKSLKQFESKSVSLQITNHSERNVDLNLELDFDQSPEFKLLCHGSFLGGRGLLCRLAGNLNEI